MIYYLRTFYSTQVELNEEEAAIAARRGVVLDGYTVKKFDTEEELYYYVRSHDYYKKPNGAVKNHILSAIMTMPTDTRRHAAIEIGYNKRVSLGIVVYCGYMVKDEKDRTIDLRNYAKELYKFDYAAYDKKVRAENREKYHVRFEEREARWERVRKLYEGKGYWGCYRQVSTTQEKRITCIDEHKPYIRGKRSFRSLPSAYDDISFVREKNWKSRTKHRKQWGVKFNAHMDTIVIREASPEGEV